MILVIDNYDSFTYNIVQQLGEFGAEIKVIRNDAMTVDEIREMAPDQILVSPGPGTPLDSGVSLDVIRELGPTTPLLGVCLGHQAIGHVYGADVGRAPRLMHGKVSTVTHNDDPLFKGVPHAFDATRYHSLIVDNLTDVLCPLAFTEQGELMALKHREYPIYGVQFHPESILTPDGPTILKNFLDGLPG